VREREMVEGEKSKGRKMEIEMNEKTKVERGRER
jgi:hypothetical protein